MQYLDIIIFAAIAAFFLTRLYLSLGRRHEDENSRPDRFSSRYIQQDEEDVEILPKNSPATEIRAITLSKPAATSLAGVIDQIRSIDREFDEKQFLQGAKEAFTLIVSAFAKGDLTTVSRLLSESVKEKFTQAIDARKLAGQELDNRIEKVVEAELISARIENNIAFMTVNFVSLQENVLRSSGGNIISGIPGKTEEIKDTWVFARELSSSDPTWILAETR